MSSSSPVLTTVPKKTKKKKILLSDSEDEKPSPPPAASTTPSKAEPEEQPKPEPAPEQPQQYETYSIPPSKGPNSAALTGTLDSVAPIAAKSALVTAPYTAAETTTKNRASSSSKEVYVPDPVVEEDESSRPAPAEVTSTGHLVLAGRGLKSIPIDLLSASERQRVKHMDLSFNEIARVDGLQELPNLETLVLDNNQLSGPQGFSKSKALKTLCLNHNELEDLKVLIDSVAASYPSLTHLSLLRNPACPNFFFGMDDDDYKKYRCYVVYRLPFLKFLDAGPVTKEEIAEAKRVGMYMIPAKPSARRADPGEGSAAAGAAEGARDGAAAEGNGEAAAEDDDEEEETPLEGGAANYGVRRFVYRGKHSEGNRFIGDTVL